MAGGLHACVPTLHSNGPKVSQALVGTAQESAEDAACGSTALCSRPRVLAAEQCFVVAIPFLTSCSHGCLGVTPALVLLQQFNPATPTLNSRVQACALPLSC